MTHKHKYYHILSTYQLLGTEFIPLYMLAHFILI